MNPAQKFDLCLRVVQGFYQLIQRDIFQNEIKLTKWFFVVPFVLISGILSCLYTIFHYDQSIAFAAVIPMSGFCQVCERISINKCL